MLQWPPMLPALPIYLVVGITDGDTLRTRCDEQLLTIRLADIAVLPNEAAIPGGRSRAPRCERTCVPLMNILVHRISGNGTRVGSPRNGCGCSLRDG